MPGGPAPPGRVGRLPARIQRPGSRGPRGRRRGWPRGTHPAIVLRPGLELGVRYPRLYQRRNIRAVHIGHQVGQQRWDFPGWGRNEGSPHGRVAASADPVLRVPDPAPQAGVGRRRHQPPMHLQQVPGPQRPAAGGYPDRFLHRFDVRQHLRRSPVRRPPPSRCSASAVSSRRGASSIDSIRDDATASTRSST